MCGIAGIWGEADRSELQQMIAAQQHRGPDGGGFHVQPALAMLGHTRLAIMDPAAVVSRSTMRTARLRWWPMA